MEEIFSKEESLQLISKMIYAAKKEQKDSGVGWIIWGWLLLATSLLTVFDIHYRWFQIGFFWNVFGGIILLYMLFAIIRSQFFKKIEKVKTYTQDLFSKLNAGFFISLMFIIFSMNLDSAGNPAVYHLKGFALLINLYGFWILIYGTALNFKPSVIASFVVWAIGFVCMIVQTFEAVMLLHAAAVLVGYIIPGYIANSEFKKLHQKGKTTDGV
jgi:hypothetical protein